MLKYYSSTTNSPLNYWFVSMKLAAISRLRHPQELDVRQYSRIEHAIETARMIQCLKMAGIFVAI